MIRIVLDVCLFVCLFYSYIRPALTWRHAGVYLQWIFNSSIYEILASMSWFRFNDFDLFVSFIFIHCCEIPSSNHCYIFELFDFSNVWIEFFELFVFSMIFDSKFICHLFFAYFWLLFILFEFMKLLFSLYHDHAIVWSLKLLYVWWFAHFWKCNVFDY